MSFGIINHIALFFVAIGVIWFFGGHLVDAVNRVAHRFHQNGFTVAFFVLGFLTSISELSVMINASIDGTPEISAGNLAGASLVIFLFIIPLLAIVGNGIALKNTLEKKQLILALITILLPALFLLDGGVNLREGIACIISYTALLYLIRKNSHNAEEIIEDVSEELVNTSQTTWFDMGKILVGAIIIFLAGNILVAEASYLAGILSVPSSIIGLIILSLGTNTPELIVAVRSIMKGHAEIAFGNYVGSAVTNTLIFGIMAIIHRFFIVEAKEFLATAIITTVGMILFYFFSKTHQRISRREGIVLFGLYLLFLSIEIAFLVGLITR